MSFGAAISAAEKGQAWEQASRPETAIGSFSKIGDPNIVP